MNYYDEWQKRWVSCITIAPGVLPIDDWQIMPLEGALKNKIIFVGRNNLLTNKSTLTEKKRAAQLYRCISGGE